MVKRSLTRYPKDHSSVCKARVNVTLMKSAGIGLHRVNDISSLVHYWLTFRDLSSTFMAGEGEGMVSSRKERHQGP